jgi:hypothetical protein
MGVSASPRGSLNLFAEHPAPGGATAPGEHREQNPSFEEASMSAQMLLRPSAAPDQVSALHAMMIEPEQSVSDAALYSPQALALLLLAAAALLSPRVPKR